MTPRGWTIFSSLIRHYHAGNEQTAIGVLSDEDQKNVVDVIAADVHGVVMRPLSLVQRMHYSWIAALIQDDEPHLQGFFLGSLPENVRPALQKLIGFGGQIPQLAETVQKFFRAQLYRRATEGIAFTPAALVPNQVGSELLQFDKEHVLNVIDYMGVYDLLPVMKQSVDQQFLNRIYRELSEHKRNFLQQLLHDKVEGALDSKGIGKVRRAEQPLSRWIHGKGLRRLATMLQASDDVFMWHLTHGLDTGRADILLKLKEKIEPSEAEQKDAQGKFQAVVSFLKY